MELDRATCDRARRSRDPRFDGRFFIAVTSTRIYCRPICPARSPKAENVRYFATAAAAQAAGFRPCLRCRPEAAPGTPAWAGTSTLVSRALRLIGDGALDEAGVEALADRLGVTGRHLRRLFLQHLGATPLDVALTRRLHFAKKLIDETSLPLHQVALAAGFGSVRRFNGTIRRVYARTPTALRARARQQIVSPPECYRFRLAYRPPYDWAFVLGFLRARATPGVEAVDASGYRRTIALAGRSGLITVARVAGAAALSVEVRFPDPRALLSIVERVRRIFDLAADPINVAEELHGDPLLARALVAHPGIRTPGAWDPFELAVRAILGQQVSVAAATTLAGRVAAQFGERVATEDALTRLFPTPLQLLSAPLERAGVMPVRANTIRELARRVANGSLPLTTASDTAGTLAALQDVPGIGAWTAQYIAMRALGEPDAFLSGDLVLRRMAGGLTARALEARSLAWRPWRAYAVMLLWQTANDTQLSSRTRHEHPDDRARVHAGRGTPRRVAARRATSTSEPGR
jgi:AraC family transcriptional regulator, regulatory protein of adaptative response / DNA-3-methyladenine glycosylase II